MGMLPCLSIYCIPVLPNPYIAPMLQCRFPTTVPPNHPISQIFHLRNSDLQVEHQPTPTDILASHPLAFLHRPSMKTTHAGTYDGSTVIDTQFTGPPIYEHPPPKLHIQSSHLHHSGASIQTLPSTGSRSPVPIPAPSLPIPHASTLPLLYPSRPFRQHRMQPLCERRIPTIGIRIFLLFQP